MSNSSSDTNGTGNSAVADPELGEVTFTRDFDAARELVFGALVDPDQLTQFWGAAGSSTPRDTIVVEPHAGGRFEAPMVSDSDGTVYPFRATFLEVTAPERIVFREVDSGLVSTSTFTDLGDGRTRLVIHQTNVPREYLVPEALDGFGTSLDKLAAYLAR